MKAIAYRQIDHTADLGIEFWGRDLRDLFANAARALFDIVGDIEQIEPQVPTPIEVEADDLEMLMVNWLNELIYRISVDEMLYRECEVSQVAPDRLSATVYGEPYDPARHELRTEIKAATYHQLCVKQEGNRWHARVIFDV